MSPTGIFFNVNGKDIHENANFDPELTLGYYLRNSLLLRGTKLGCEEGVCGSCTVVLGTWDKQTNKARYRAVNACLVPLFHVHNTFVITVEGIGSQDKLHPIQQKMSMGHALQCGFCSPGFVMSAYALLRNNPSPSREEINDAVKGNLCRCTGYRPILESLYSFSPSGGCCGGKDKNSKGCCKNVKTNEEEENDIALTSFADFPKYDPSQEIIFPPSLIVFEDSKNSIHLKGDRIELVLPKTKNDLIENLKVDGAKVIASGLITRLVTASKSSNQLHEIWVSTKYVEEFNKIQVDENSIKVGSAHTIQTLVETLVKNSEPLVASAVQNFFQNYSSLQVANFASWVGSIVMGIRSKMSVSDALLLLLTLNAKLTILDRNDGELKELGIEEFIRDYEDLTSVIIFSVEFNKNENRQLFLYKIGESSEKDSTVFNFGALVGKNLEETRIFVGLGGPPKRLNIKGSDLKNITLAEFEKHFDQSFGISKHHLSIAFHKFTDFLKNGGHLETEKREISYLQFMQPSKNTYVGRPLENYYNERAISGEAIYINDIQASNALHVGFVLSTRAHAKILSIDASEVLKMEGVEDYISLQDVPGNNIPGLSEANMNFIDDTVIFADGVVESIGQVIGAVLAKDVVLARRAAKLVKIEYEALPIIADFKKAREANSLLGDKQHFGKSEKEIRETLSECAHVFEGDARIGGQDHYYLETQSSLVVPGEAGEMVVYCSTQATSFTQLMVAEVMNVPAHKIIVKTKRLGGGFGGKVQNASWVAAVCAVGAKKLKRPVYGHLSRSDDLIMTGKRHEVYAKYRVGTDESGKVKGVQYEAWLNGGWSKDHTEGVTMVMGVKIDDVYNLGTVGFDGYPVKTNTCSNTALRGYGMPQGKMVNEGMMRRIAYELKKEVEDVKKLNFLKEGGTNYMGGRVHSDALLECWEYCRKMSDFDNKKEEIEKFNETSKFVKRGIAISNVRFGLPHPGPTAHGIASLLINLDGSVQLSIGGTEMGQGLNMKMLQVCSEALNRPIETITIVDSSTDKVTNAPETGGSQNADTNGLAVLACCKRLMKGLKPLVEKNEGNWQKAVVEAFKAYVPLQCTEYGIAERESFGVKSFESPYNTTGACAVEVEVDCLTGFNKLISVSIVMDVGESINPAIDIGQIEGAFMQAYGLVTCERITFDKSTGKLNEGLAGKYKIPRAFMVPNNFQIKLLGAGKTKGTQVYSSKGIGEPPMMMSAGAVHTAMMKSIDSYRRENNLNEFVETISPLCSETVIKLCSGN